MDKSFFGAVGIFVQERINQILQPFLAREAKLAESITKLELELEAQREIQQAMRYCGVWREGLFERGNAVTHEGSLFIALV